MVFLSPTAAVMIHNGIAVLIAKPFKDPLRGMPLLLRPTLILRQDTVDDPGERVELWTRRRLAPPVTRRNRERQPLGYCPRGAPKLPRPFPPAQTPDLYRGPTPPIELHDLHPPPPAAFGQRPSAAGVLLRR